MIGACSMRVFLRICEHDVAAEVAAVDTAQLLGAGAGEEAAAADGFNHPTPTQSFSAMGPQSQPASVLDPHPLHHGVGS